MQDVVAPAPPDARHHVLVAQVGGQMALGVAGADEARRTPRCPGSGPSPARGPSSPGASTHHDALRWVPCSRTRTPMPAAVEPGVAVAEDEAGHRATGLRLLGRLLDVEAAGLGEVEDDPVPSSNVPHQVLGPAGDRDEAVALAATSGGGS